MVAVNLLKDLCPIIARAVLMPLVLFPRWKKEIIKSLPEKILECEIQTNIKWSYKFFHLGFPLPLRVTLLLVLPPKNEPRAWQQLRILVPSTTPTCGVGTHLSSWGWWVCPKAVDSWSLSQGFQHLGMVILDSEAVGVLNRQDFQGPCWRKSKEDSSTACYKCRDSSKET